jgi:glycosyltransferase involved in cell wall biosynthesis
MTPSAVPLISCLCISRSPHELLGRAIRCFEQQTYPNKELIIVRQVGQEPADRRFLEQFGHLNLKCFFVSVKEVRSLGDLRNFAIHAASGDYFCTWDDDDWHNTKRLQTQMTALVENYHPVCMLTNVIIYSGSKRAAFFSVVGLWEGTLLCSMDVVKKGIQYPSVSRGEDTAFLHQLYQHEKIYPVAAHGLYIYVQHGSNTCEQDHFEMLTRDAQMLCSRTLTLIEDILSEKISASDGSHTLNADPLIAGEFNYFHYQKVLLSGNSNKNKE